MQTLDVLRGVDEWEDLAERWELQGDGTTRKLLKNPTAKFFFYFFCFCFFCFSFIFFFFYVSVTLISCGPSYDGGGPRFHFLTISLRFPYALIFLMVWCEADTQLCVDKCFQLFTAELDFLQRRSLTFSQRFLLVELPIRWLRIDWSNVVTAVNWWVLKITSVLVSLSLSVHLSS